MSYPCPVLGRRMALAALAVALASKEYDVPLGLDLEQVIMDDMVECVVYRSSPDESIGVRWK